MGAYSGDDSSDAKIEITLNGEIIEVRILLVFKLGLAPKYDLEHMEMELKLQSGEGVELQNMGEDSPPNPNTTDTEKGK